MDLSGSGDRMSGARWQPVVPCAARCRRIGSPIYQDFRFWRPGLKAWCLDVWMLAGLEWIGGGDGGDGGEG